MDLSEKCLNLRKANGLTQEQVAEKTGVSRQSVSKWESGQSVPELDKIVALCELFNVSTDYLLKPTEIDLLSVKTQMLENQQKTLEQTMQSKKEWQKKTLLGCIAIYLIAFAVLILIDSLTWMNDFLWNLLPGLTLHIILFCIATAVSIVFCLRRKPDFH